ncbi:hypothetical protein [Saprospira grandis]|uniref:Uncharacterized protein n=1 Tax=Saprospira grandis (strain Lewin) TaxID=984262 RepID=H6L2X9_SAPGL|nr:hypothetical protein [Saprospira grandis]AFC23706.1 hypothetical protein SGRA_0970 [Saprospira grandis str. Lewin]
MPMHLKYIVSFNNLPKIKEIRSALLKNSGTDFDFSSLDLEEKNYYVDIYLEGSSSVEVEVDTNNNELKLYTTTFRLYYLEGHLLKVLKDFGGQVEPNVKLPYWTKRPLNSLSEKQHEKILGTPKYKKKWWEKILDSIW